MLAILSPMAGFKYFFRRLPLLLVLATLLLAAWKHTAILDWAKLRGYQPPAAVSRLVSEDAMTPAAQHIFYVNRPQLVDSSGQFRQDCPQVEQTIVLGCYQSGENGIFLRTVKDPRLNGVIEVTAAHEMLHGAYERLGSQDKKTVDALLQDFYQNQLHDQRLLDTIKAYKKSEPEAVVDEMHSVFGTEIANLPAPLESYYQRYFTNRSAITNFAAGYEDEFNSRLDKIKAYESQLSDLKQQIDGEESALSSQAAQLQADRASLESLRASGQVAAYNARVAAFNQEVDNYNAGVSRLKSDIATYNAIVEQHNQLADELRGLYSSLGTNLNQQPAQ